MKTVEIDVNAPNQTYGYYFTNLMELGSDEKLFLLSYYNKNNDDLVTYTYVKAINEKIAKQLAIFHRNSYINTLHFWRKLSSIVPLRIEIDEVEVDEIV